MASIPQYYNSDYIFSNELCEFPPPVAGGVVMCCEESLPFFDNGAFDRVPTESDVTSSFSMASVPERFGVSDMAVPTLPEFYLGRCDSVARNYQSFGERCQPDISEFREESTGAVPDFRAVYPTSGANWAIQGKPVPVVDQESTMKYACRKTLADKRVRVRGRFARNNELCEEEEVMKRNKLPDHEERGFCDDSFQIKHDGEDWLQEALASLMHLPYIEG
ncbi:hypothetical protein F0562_009873 [Nyssa sinensis]|uniref:CCT domain-containing protein n=1 Tax=Nyssa sinensis TaxID=561372 RepID=A0A5J4ZYY4_9ASTE|nr:hypothetical protein F0562_009873 [Nyssa sinensis]